MLTDRVYLNKSETIHSQYYAETFGNLKYGISGKEMLT